MAITAKDLELLEFLGHMPLAGGSDLVNAWPGLNVRVYQRLQRLKELGLVHGEGLGWSRRRCQRWWLSAAGLARLGWAWHGFNTNQGIRHLVRRLPVVEQFYHLMSRLDQDQWGELLEFHWLRRRVSFDAVARFQQGWMALIWCGLYAWVVGL